jgi:hypothetical protein
LPHGPAIHGTASGALLPSGGFNVVNVPDPELDPQVTLKKYCVSPWSARE